jgi:hypothetical protein
MSLHFTDKAESAAQTLRKSRSLHRVVGPLPVDHQYGPLFDLILLAQYI